MFAERSAEAGTSNVNWLGQPWRQLADEVVNARTLFRDDEIFFVMTKSVQLGP